MTQGKILWQSNSSNKGVAPYKWIMQEDGNLVIYDSRNLPIWASNTDGKGKAPYRLIMQDDSNLVIYDSKNLPIWASNWWI